MGQVHQFPAQPRDRDAAAKPPATVTCIDGAYCGLCGAKLSAKALRYHVVSPQCCDATITVCHTCHKAALGEGYRPAE